MNTAKQFLLLRLPVARECVALALLSVFFFIQLVSFCEAFDERSAAKVADSVVYASNHVIKPVSSEKASSIEKFALIAVLAAEGVDQQPQSILRLDSSPPVFFLSDYISSSLLLGRAPPVA